MSTFNPTHELFNVALITLLIQSIYRLAITENQTRKNIFYTIKYLYLFFCLVISILWIDNHPQYTATILMVVFSGGLIPLIIKSVERKFYDFAAFFLGVYILGLYGIFSCGFKHQFVGISIGIFFILTYYVLLFFKKIVNYIFSFILSNHLF